MVNEPLVTDADLTGFRGAPYPASVLGAAYESVRDECGWHIAPAVEQVVKLRGGSSVILLPSLCVTAVASVVDFDGLTIDGWEWYPNGVIESGSGTFPRTVTVTFTHGYATCPKALLPVIAERAQSQAAGRVKSESLGGRAVSLEAGYDPATEAALAKYRLNYGA